MSRKDKTKEEFDDVPSTQKDEREDNNNLSNDDDEMDEEEKRRRRKNLIKDEIKTHLKTLFTIGLLIVFFIFGLGVFDTLDKEVSDKMPYPAFKKLVKDGEIGYVLLEEDRIKYLTHNQFEEYKNTPKILSFQIEMAETYNPNDEDLKKQLLEKGIVVSEKKDSPLMDTFAETLIIVAVLWVAILLFLRVREKGFNFGGQASIGGQKTAKTKHEPVALNDITFDDVIGVDEAKEEVEIIVDMLKHPKKYQGVKVPSGFMFYGATGTGKTLLARAIANEAGVPMYYASATDFVQTYVGEGARRIRELFQAAKQHERAIIFIDEIDAVALSRSGDYVDNTEDRRTLNALLTELDGFNTKGNETIITIGATNRIEDMDEAFLRPGRFDKKIAFQLPKEKDRERLLTHYLKEHELADDVSLPGYAQTTIGMSGADLAQIANEAALLARVKGQKVIEREHIDLAFYKVVMKGNPSKQGHEKEMEELVAWHEAGHALLAKKFTRMHVPKVSIIPSTTGAGGITFIVPQQEELQTKKDIEGEIITIYGGRIAEELLVGKDNITIGASNDIDKASESIKLYIERYGMSEEYEMLNPSYFVDDNHQSLIYANELSKKLYSVGYEWLSTHKELLKRVACLLIERKTINENELDEIIEKYFAEKT